MPARSSDWVSKPGSRVSAFFRDKVQRFLDVKSARGVSFAISIVSMSSKPLGYLRMLITAWAFGTSPGMDSFHLASGIISLFAGSIGTAMQSAVLPEIERIRTSGGGEDACSSLFAAISWIVIALASLMCAAFAIAPGVMVRFFAGGFDPERIRIGAVMLWWLTPFAVATMCRPLLEIWAMFREKYTLSSVSSFLFNFIAIPTLLVAGPIIGVYSVALCMSVGHFASFTLFLLALRGIPLVVRRSALLFGSILTIAKNAFYSFVLTAASTMFMIVDRYFASRLPSGSVASISYGGSIIGIVSLAATTPMLFFLARMSRAVNADPEAAKNTVRQTMALIVAYFLPVGFFLSAAARPVISIVYGWGNFGAESVDMTSTALSAYGFGLVFSLAAVVISRYAQAQQKMGTVVVLTYVLISLNAFLDWLLVEPMGIFGLALATSITQCASFIIYFLVVMREPMIGFAYSIKLPQQFVAVSILSYAAYSANAWGTMPHVAATLATASGYFLFAEKVGLFSSVPEHWRPLKLAGFLLSALKSYCSKGGS